MMTAAAALSAVVDSSYRGEDGGGMGRGGVGWGWGWMVLVGRTEGEELVDPLFLDLVDFLGVVQYTVGR